MPNQRKLRLHDLKRRADALASDIAHVIAWDAAVEMAHQERTGKPMLPETLYLPEDEARALEIMKMRPR